MTSLERYLSVMQGLQLDRMHRQVSIDGKLIPRPLSRRAFRLLEFLAAHAGQVCSREETSKAVYGEPYSPRRDDARLDALIERTRAHIGDDQRHSRFLKTVRGTGHRLINCTPINCTPNEQCLYDEHRSVNDRPHPTPQLAMASGV